MSLPDPVRALLSGRAFAHLATVLPDGSPHSVPVWIDVDENDRLVMFTQTGSRKARNIERDGRVAISVVDIANPYNQADLRGRVVARIDGERALTIADALSVKYTGAAFPWRSPDTVVYAIEPDVSHHAELPFTHS